MGRSTRASLRKKCMHAYCWFVLEKGKSLVSGCSFPRAFPFIQLSNSHFPTERLLRKPGMMVSNSIFHLSQAKAVKNPFKQYFFISLLGSRSSLSHFLQGTASGASFTFFPCFYGTIIYESASSNCRNWTGHCAIVVSRLAFSPEFGSSTPVSVTQV